MQLAVIPLRPEHIPTIARICYDAFGALQDRHGVERDFESLATTEMLFGMMASRPDFAGYVAVDQSRAAGLDKDGKPTKESGMKIGPASGEEILGSNFVMFCDNVMGVGPITVRPDVQHKGVGTLLMSLAFCEASQRGITKIRLIQEAINTTSLALYTKMGYDCRFAAAIIRPAPADEDDARVVPVTVEHLPVIDSLSTRGFHDSRVNEVAGFLRHGFPGFILLREEANGQKVVGGYYFPGMFGHGFAATAIDMADLIGQAVRRSPPMFHKAILPLDQGELHRLLMERGMRTIKLMNYMSFGEYTHPIGAWMPSIGM